LLALRSEQPGLGHLLWHRARDCLPSAAPAPARLMLRLVVDAGDAAAGGERPTPRAVDRVSNPLRAKAEPDAGLGDVEANPGRNLHRPADTEAHRTSEPTRAARRESSTAQEGRLLRRCEIR